MESSHTMHSKAKDITMVGLFTALMAVFSQISIPTQPVPFSLGIFAAFLAATVLPLRLALATQVVYLLLGAVGVPVFSGFQGGLQRLVGPTGGYLAGYVLMALVMGLLFAHLPHSRRYPVAVGITLLGQASCYLCGTLWLAVTTGTSFGAALSLAVFPFVVPDCVKALLSALVGLRLRRHTSSRYINISL